MRLSGELERAAAHAAHVVIADAGCETARGLVRASRDAVPRPQIIVSRLERFELREDRAPHAAGLVRKRAQLPVAAVQTVVAYGIEARACFEHEHAQTALAQAPRRSRAARTAADDDGVERGRHFQWSG
jgi:hypothetical protein